MSHALATEGAPSGWSSQAEAPEYLDCLQALARELEGAMQSLAVNGLSAFEESVARQLVLCSRLSSLAAGHQSSRSEALGSGAACIDAGPGQDEFGVRIEEAKAKLVKLNRNYSALLNHGRRTVQMFASLARCYSGYPHACVAEPNRTWSAEI